MPYAIFLASHACSQCLMSKLLPRPTPQLPPLLQEVSFQPHIDNKEEQAYLADETERDIEMVDAHNGSKKDDSGFFYEEEIALQQNDNNDVKLGVEVDGGMEGHLRRGSNEVKSMIDIGNEIDELKTLTTVVLEDQAIEEEDLQRETKGLLEKIRDEGRTDSTLRSGEYVEGGINENDSDKKIGPVVEDAQEDENGCIIGGTEEGDLRNEEDPNVCEEMLLLSRNDDTICNEVESDEPLLEGKEVDDINDSPKASDTIPTEPVLMQVYNISVPEELSEVTGDINIVVEEEPKHLPDGPATLQKEKLDNNISDSVNQESQLQEYDEMMDLSNADAREIALDLFDEKRIDPVEYAYAIGSHEESSNVGGHTDSMEVLVSSVEQESMPSECSSQEVILDEEDIWKQIHGIRKIVGYEGTIQASCAQELKALYIFTGVEPPAFLNENSNDPIEIKEKLHFLMSIVGIKSH